jgi:hypothetical protein
MNTEFLLHSNINSLYKSIKERIHSQINYNIDKKEEKYRNVINKLLIKISKKDGIGLEDLNSMALQTICPFLISKIQNTKTPTITFTPTRNIDRITPIRAVPIQKTTHELDSFMADSNLNFSSNIIDNNDSYKQEPNDKFLSSLEGFQNFDHSDENTLESFKDNENLNSNIIGDTTEYFQNPTTTLSSSERLYNEMVEYKEVNERKPYGDIILNELKSKQLLINLLNTVENTINMELINRLIDTKIPKNNYIDDLKLELFPDGTNIDYGKNELINKLKIYKSSTFTYDEYLTYNIIKHKLISIRNYIITEAAKKQNGKQIDTDTELTIQFKSDDKSAPEWVRNNGVFFSLDKHSRVLTIRKTKNTIMFNTSNPKTPRVLESLKSFFKELRSKITILVGFKHSKLVIGDTTIQLGNGNGESIKVEVKEYIENLNKIVETIDQFINDKMNPILNKAKERETKDIINARSIEPSFTTASLYNQEGGGSDPYINRQNRLIDFQNKQIEDLKLAFNVLKTKVDDDTVEEYLDLYQISTNTIKHKTLLILDIVRHRENPASVEDIFRNWGLLAAPTPIGISDIKKFEIRLGDPLVYPPNTEVTLEYFTIHKFKGITNNEFMQHKRMEDFDSFIIKINGGKFSSFKHYSNTDTFSERASIIVPNDGFGFSDSNEGSTGLISVDAVDADRDTSAEASKDDQVTYTLKPKHNYIGTFTEGGIIDTLHIDLMGSYVHSLPGNNPADVGVDLNTWAYLYPYDKTSRCTIGLMLKPLPR